AFGDDVDAGAAGQADDGLHDGQVVGVVGQAGDEAAVEFEYVDRQALEVGQRGVTGAEVVQGDRDAEGAQAGEGLGGDFDVGQQGAFGQLQAQARGRQAACGERAVDVVDQAGLGELARGQVDAQPGRVAVGRHRPLPRLPAGLVQQPAPDRQDQTAAFDDVDEFAGRAHAAFAVVPAQQGLGGDPAAAGQVDLGLEVHPHVAGLERLAQHALQLQPGDQAAMVFGVEDLAAVQ